MNKLSHIELLLQSIRDDAALSDSEKDIHYDIVDSCVGTYVKYHNTAVEQGQSLIIQRFRMDFGQYAEYVGRQHEYRKELHKSMIDHTAMLNRLCEEQGIAKIYGGPLDLTKGRDDAETRFGIAAFGEELCRDLFRTTETLGVPAKAHEAYKDYAKRLAKDAGAWGTVQRMLAQAEAKSHMDASQYGI